MWLRNLCALDTPRDGICRDLADLTAGASVHVVLDRLFHNQEMKYVARGVKCREFGSPSQQSSELKSRKETLEVKAIVMNRPGGPGVLEMVDRPEPTPAQGEALVEVAAAGVNFMDIGVRRGQFWTEMAYPKTIGVEGAGRVLAMGDSADSVQPGQRVPWRSLPGSYVTRVVIPAAALVAVPDAIDDRTAAAVMMQGPTASHFTTDFYPVQPGDIALVHAAAGGVDSLLTQIIKLKGGRVIGLVSRADKGRCSAASRRRSPDCRY
jgi:D-arabinose 1-dehydrogenase-like Zn-dependent alcohol dehydrogenase